MVENYKNFKSKTKQTLLSNKHVFKVSYKEQIKRFLDYQKFLFDEETTKINETTEINKEKESVKSFINYQKVTIRFQDSSISVNDVIGENSIYQKDILEKTWKKPDWQRTYIQTIADVVNKKSMLLSLELKQFYQSVNTFSSGTLLCFRATGQTEDISKKQMNATIDRIAAMTVMELDDEKEEITVINFFTLYSFIKSVIEYKKLNEVVDDICDRTDNILMEDLILPEFDNNEDHEEKLMFSELFEKLNKCLDLINQKKLPSVNMNVIVKDVLKILHGLRLQKYENCSLVELINSYFDDITAKLNIAEQTKKTKREIWTSKILPLVKKIQNSRFIISLFVFFVYSAIFSVIIRFFLFAVILSKTYKLRSR